MGSGASAIITTLCEKTFPSSRFSFSGLFTDLIKRKGILIAVNYKLTHSEIHSAPEISPQLQHLLL